MAKNGLFPPFDLIFAIFEHSFLILKTMAKKAKSIVTLSLPKCLKRLYCKFCFICPKSASGSMHRRPLCLSPSSEVSKSLAFLYICSIYDLPKLFDYYFSLYNILLLKDTLYNLLLYIENFPIYIRFRFYYLLFL